MNPICPLCNGLFSSKVVCACGQDMLDQGPLQDYLGPYSPYSAADGAAPACVHLFRCPNCYRDQRVTVNPTNTFAGLPRSQ